MPDLIPMERIESKILLIRGQKVMLDRDLAVLYGVETRRLGEQVKRNIERFPEDFMFQLNTQEISDLISQFATSKKGRGGHRKAPYAFTEQGVAMLSCVLRSGRAVNVNIQIIRAFVRLRKILATHEEIRQKIEEHDNKISILFDTILQLMAPPPVPVPTKKKIGFNQEE